MAGDADEGVARGTGIVAVGFEFEEAVGAGTLVVRSDVIGLAMDHSLRGNDQVEIARRYPLALVHSLARLLPSETESWR
jgi:hypothetical protein